MTDLSFRFLDEIAPGTVWQKLVKHGWPGWRSWFIEHGGVDGPTEKEGRHAIRRHLPRYEALLDELLEQAGGDAQLAQFLTFWSPPRYLVGCTQLAVSDAEGPLLIRNYDLDPSLNETTMLRSGWQGQNVIGMVEAMAGLSDGMNEHGLVASLTFGGRVVRGNGFGIPLIIRYLLQQCRDVQDGLGFLRSVPTHMSYNVTLTDPSGEVVTVMLSPDRPPIVNELQWSTNHQLGVEWPHHGRMTKSVERAEALERLLAAGMTDATRLKTRFLSTPIYSDGHDQGFGTVFTVLYRPQKRRVEIGWQDNKFIPWGLQGPAPAAVNVRYALGGSSTQRVAHAP